MIKNDTSWSLVHICQATKAGTESLTNIDIRQRLSTVEKEAIFSDQATIRNAISSLHIGSAVMNNRNFLIESLINLGSSFLHGDYDQENFSFSHAFDISHKLLNLLASFRAYIEHQRTHFIREHGRSSNTTKGWTDFIASISASNPQYSLFLGLRNFIQHVDMPPLGFKMHSSDPDSISLNVYLIKQKLLDPNAQWSPEQRAFIAASDGQISLWNLLEAWDHEFRRILRENERIRVLPARDAAINLLSIRQRYSIPDSGRIALAPIDETNISKESFSISLQWIEEKEAGELLRICENHTVDGNSYHILTLPNG